MNEAIQCLEEWAKHSPTLAYIAECLKKVMTPELATWIMQDSKTAKGMWDYITTQAKKQHNKGADGVLVTPSQMQGYIYAYLREDVPAQIKPTVNAVVPEKAKVEAADGQMSLVDDIAVEDDGQMTLI